MTNEQMIKGRFLKLAKGRKILARMNKAWDNGGFVRISTALKVTDYEPKHRDMVVMGKSGSLYVKAGKNHNCINFCSIQFSA